MKNVREIYKAWAEGKKMRYEGWSNGAFIFMNDEGKLKDDSGSIRDPYFGEPSKWSIYEEPKAKKLYAHFDNDFRDEIRFFKIEKRPYDDWTRVPEYDIEYGEEK